MRWTAIQAALNTAAHPSTPDAEAIAALRRANALLKKQDLSLSDLSVKEADASPADGWNATLHRIEELESAVSAYARSETRLNSEKAVLQQRVTELERQLKNARSSSVPRPKPKPTIEERMAGQTELFGELLSQKAAADDEASRLAVELEGLKHELHRVEAASKVEITDLKQQLAQAQAAPKPQPLNPKIPKERLEFLRIAQYLGEYVSDSVWKRCVSQGRNHANLVGQAGRATQWPTAETMIVGEVTYSTRGPTFKAKKL